MSKPMFQRRHYEAVARQMKKLKTSALITVTEDTHTVWCLTVGYLSGMFQMDNPQFKSGKFQAACGVED